MAVGDGFGEEAGLGQVGGQFAGIDGPRTRALGLAVFVHQLVVADVEQMGTPLLDTEPDRRLAAARVLESRKSNGITVGSTFVPSPLSPSGGVGAATASRRGRTLGSGTMWGSV